MKVVYVHHHLRPGGVSRVIARQISSLGDSVRALLIVGEPPLSPPPFPYRVVPGLAYDRDRESREPPRAIADDLYKAVFSFFKEEPDILHFHNPTLGKNSDLLEVIEVLVDNGSRPLLQIHDFAEDGRPMNYSHKPYPENCHYAVLNTRDYEILLKAGLVPEGLHLIPNPVEPLPCGEGKQKERDVVLYPVRAIRRKNIGEAALLSLFTAETKTVGITLEPTGPLDCRSYDDWRGFVKENGLRVSFRLGIEQRFEDVLKRAICTITTSIKEGFGYCFLEPWTCRKMLFGRVLPDICSDFEKNNIDLSHLYSRIDVPLEFFDLEMFVTKWKRCYKERLARYSLLADDGLVEEHLQSLVQGGKIDFCLLSEDLQREVIRRVSGRKSAFHKMLDENPFLVRFSLLKEDKEIIENNRKTVKEIYSLDRCRDTLLGVYTKVMGREVHQSIDKRIVLEEFNAPEKSHLLLCDSAYG